MIIHNFEQGSEEWFNVRLGKFTGSNAQAVASNGKGLETLVYEKVAELLTGKPKANYTNEDMERGKELENIARSMYELETGAMVTQAGFVEESEFAGCSPDGLVGEEGLIEIKCKNDANFVKYKYTGEIESDYLWQMQFELFITGRKWCDYVVFNPNFNNSIVIKRIERDEAKILQIIAGINMGIAQIKTILEKVK